ncbi:polysaccharide deacetylase family protein, partial [Streptomyces sp. NPDC015350]
MRRAHRLPAGPLAAGALLTATGCAQSVDPIERLGRKAAQWVGHPDRAPGGRAERHGPSVRCPLGVR